MNFSIKTKRSFFSAMLNAITCFQIQWHGVRVNSIFAVDLNFAPNLVKFSKCFFIKNKLDVLVKYINEFGM